MEECCICYNKKEKFVELHCKHRFCPECLLHIILINRRCALCRATFTASDIEKIKSHEEKVFWLIFNGHVSQVIDKRIANHLERCFNQKSIYLMRIEHSLYDLHNMVMQRNAFKNCRMILLLSRDHSCWVVFNEHFLC